MTYRFPLVVPANCGYDPERAMELANLIWLANCHYDWTQEHPNQAWEPAMGGGLVGSAQLSFDAKHAPEKGELSYELLDTFWFTEVHRLRTETVPFGFIARRDLNGKPAIFIAFRGTREKAEWIDNIQAKPVNCLDDPNLGKVSYGFQKIFTRSYDQLDPVTRGLNATKDSHLPASEKRGLMATLLETLADSNRCPDGAQVYVAGHSLGGALSTLAALTVARRTRFKEPLLYTFASPRVGDPTFAAQFAALTVYRIANSEDLVPSVPPASGNLLGEDMKKEDLSVGQRQRLDALEGLKFAFLHNLTDVNYQHVGLPLTFTDHRLSISYNHNLEHTYREAL